MPRQKESDGAIVVSVLSYFLLASINVISAFAVARWRVLGQPNQGR